SARWLEESRLLRINGKAALGVLERDPAAGFIVMRRLAALIARYLASSGVQLREARAKSQNQEGVMDRRHFAAAAITGVFATCASLPALAADIDYGKPGT